MSEHVGHISNLTRAIKLEADHYVDKFDDPDMSEQDIAEYAAEQVVLENEVQSDLEELAIMICHDALQSKRQAEKERRQQRKHEKLHQPEVV